MNEKMLRAMVAAGAIKKIRIIGHSARFHIEASTPNGVITTDLRTGKHTILRGIAGVERIE